MLTDIQKVRIEVQDNDVVFPLLDDSTYEYLLEKNGNSIIKSSLDAARLILFQLSQRDDNTVDIFSTKGSKAAENYRLSLELYLRNPSLNPLIGRAIGYVGGVSNADMTANNNTSDNHRFVHPSESPRNAFPTNFYE